MHSPDYFDNTPTNSDSLEIKYADNFNNILNSILAEQCKRSRCTSESPTMDEQNSSPRSTTRERPSQRPPAPPKSFDNQGFQSDEKSNSDTNHNHTKEQNSFGVQTTNGKNQYEAVNLELVNIVPRDKRQVQIDLSSTNPYDEYFVPVNEHRKYIRGEKLYVTADKRDEKKSGFKKSCIWVLGIVIIGLAVVLGALAASGVISTTPATQVNDTTISSARAFGGISDYTKENITFVPRTVEGVLKIDNEEYKGYYSDPDSEEYKAFTQTISKALVKALFGDHTLNHSGNNIKLEIINLRNGSIVVTYRIHWTPKQNGMTTDPISYDSLNKVLTKYLNDNRRMLDVYHVAEDGLEARNLIDICKDDHKGCEYGCEFNEETLEFECICPDGKVPSIRENNQCVYPTQNIPYINKTTTSNNKNERTEENKSGFDYEDYLEDNKENNLSFVDKVTFPTLPSTSSTETSSAVASTDIFGLMEKELENESREGGDDTSESTPHLEIQPTPEPQPSSKPTPKPTPEPTPEPTSEPSPEPSPEPTPEPISEPKPEPTPVPFSIIDFAVKSEVKSTQSSNLGNPESNLDPKAEPASGYMREKSTQKAEPKLNTESKPNDHMLFPFERVLHTSENKTERIIEVTTMEDKLEPTPVNFVNPMLKSTTETIDKSSDISSELKDLIGGRESSYKSFVKPKFAIQNNKTEKHKTVNEEDTIEKIVLGNTTDIKQISTESITRPSFMNENDTTESSENMQEEIGDTKLNLPIVEENSESDELFNQSTKEPTTVNDSEMSFTFPINSDETPKIFATSVNEIHRIQNEKQKHDSKNEKVTSFSGSSSEELLTILNASPIKEDNSENEEETTTVTNKVTELKEVITTTLPSTSSITTLHVLKAIEDKISEKINNSTGIDISDNSDEYLTSDIDLTTPAADEYEDSYAVVTDYDLDHHIRVNKHSETTTKITFEKTQTTPASTHESNEYQNRTEAVFKNPTESLPTTTAKNYVPMVHTTSNDTKESSNRTLNPAPVWESTEDVSTTTFGFRNDPYIKHPETSTMNIENVTSIPIENDEYDMSPFLPEIRNNKSLVKILHEGHDIPQTDNPKDSQNEQTTVQMEMNQDLGNDSSTAAGNILTTTEKTWLRSNNSRSFNTYDVTELPESNEFIPVANFSNRVIDSKILTNYRDETHSIKATSESDLLETTTDTESSSSKNKFEYDDFTEHELNMDYLESGTESNNTDDDDEEIRKLLKIAATQDTANATETTNIETDYLENESDEYETTESSVENNTDETTVNSHEHVEPKTKNLETEHGHDNKFSYDVSDLIDSKTRNSSQNESDMVSSSESNLSAPASVKIWSIKDVIESAEKNNEDSKPDQEFSEPVEPLKVLPLNKPAKLAENEDNVVSLSGDKDRENKV